MAFHPRSPGPVLDPLTRFGGSMQNAFAAGRFSSTGALRERMQHAVAEGCRTTMKFEIDSRPPAPGMDVSLERPRVQPSRPGLTSGLIGFSGSTSRGPCCRPVSQRRRPAALTRVARHRDRRRGVPGQLPSGSPNRMDAGFDLSVPCLGQLPEPMFQVTENMELSARPSQPQARRADASLLGEVCVLHAPGSCLQDKGLRPSEGWRWRTQTAGLWRQTATPPIHCSLPEARQPPFQTLAG
jgi:hypothetical protein